MKAIFSLILLSSATLAAIPSERNKTPPSTYLAQKPGAPKICIREEAEENQLDDENIVVDSSEIKKPEILIVDDEDSDKKAD